MLSGAPFGYRYVRKSEQSAAYYEINEVEACKAPSFHGLKQRPFTSVAADRVVFLS